MTAVIELVRPIYNRGNVPPRGSWTVVSREGGWGAACIYCFLFLLPLCGCNGTTASSFCCLYFFAMTDFTLELCAEIKHFLQSSFCSGYFLPATGKEVKTVVPLFIKVETQPSHLLWIGASTHRCSPKVTSGVEVLLWFVVQTLIYIINNLYNAS